MSQSTDEVEDLNNPEYRAKHQHEFGQRLLSTLIDDRARRNHPRPFASIPRSANPKDGYQDISYRLFANAVDRCAWWMKNQLSLANSLEPVIYVGAFDLRYQILATAAIKTECVMFFISPRNSMEAQLSLIDGSEVNKILVSSGSAIESMIKPILEQRPLQKFQIPELDELLSEADDVTPYEFNPSYDEYRMRPWLMLHTSGSTGLPKPVTLRHGFAATFEAVWLHPNENENDTLVSFTQKRMFVPSPPFHVAGVVANLACSVFMDATVVLPPQVPLTAEVVNDIFLNARVEVANISPVILMDMVKNPTYLESLHHLTTIAYSGGALPQETGDELNKFARVTSFFGSTETGIVTSLLRPRQHWKYHKFDTELSGIELRLVDETTGLHELVFVRNPKLSLFQAIFFTFPDADEYRSKDLFSKHPTEPDLWRYEGRLDDLIVLNNGEKINPVAMEGTITSCPIVKAALVVGSGRFQTGLLVEVDNPPQLNQKKEKEELLDSIWPYIDMANQNCPTYGRIARELVRFNQADKSFVRAGKGTIQRAPSLKLLSKEIEELYAEADKTESQPNGQFPEVYENVNNTEDFLHHWILQETRLGDIQLEQDFFANGMDSLDVVNLTRQIRSTGQYISTKRVYDNPTIKKLALSLRANHNGVQNEMNDSKRDLDEMQQMFHEFKFHATEQSERPHSTSDASITDTKHVVLIGSTGTLGPYLLDELLNDPSVIKVTCLNRSVDALSRQKSKHIALRLNTDFHRVSFLKSDLGEAHLGLKTSDYEELVQSATHIIHNAWAVDFNRHVSSFKPLLQSVKNVIALTYTCLPRQARLFFVSSVSIADRLRADRPGDQVYETPLDDWTLAGLGYGQSKVVAEGLITDAVERHGIDAAICRLCQLGGPVSKEGEWNRAEWIPRLVFSSKAMGIIPASLGSVDMIDWLPIDLVATICLELLFCDNSKVPREVQDGCSDEHVASTQRRARVWHVVNPNPALWSLLLPHITSRLPSTVETTDLAHWVERLKQGIDPSSTKDAWNPEHVPAMHLIALFEELKTRALKRPKAEPVAVFDTDRTAACSKTLAQAPAVSPAWIELWMKQWGF